MLNKRIYRVTPKELIVLIIYKHIEMSLIYINHNISKVTRIESGNDMTVFYIA